MRLPVAITLIAALALSACGDRARLSVADGTGPSPQLPEPRPTLIPTVKIASVEGWAEGQTPVAAPGLRVSAFAAGLDHPRWLLALPNGDVLVAETGTPTPHDKGTGIKGWIMQLVMGLVGAQVPSPDRIVLLRDSDGDGVAEVRSVLLDGLHSPFGMALVGNDLYVANTDAVLRFPYRDGETRITEPGSKVTDLPAGPINHHWTKSLRASPDGRRLYVGVGSNSNVAENGLEAEDERAAIWEIVAATGAHRVLASGLRNPVGIDWEPTTGALWVAVNERDEIGSDLVPDYMTRVRDGGFYGWPYSYYGAHVDTRVKPQRPDIVASALVPDYALGAHTASLGLAFSRTPGLPQPFDNGAFVGQHGSWNRDPPSGYKVIYVPFADGVPAGPPIDVLTGFLGENGKARGRPVGVTPDHRGGLLVVDDVGNRIWRVSADPPRTAPLRAGR